MLIFAYGSNMFPLRLKNRVPSSHVVSTGLLCRHRIIFNKLGNDGSAKANALYTGREKDIIHGVIYEIDPLEKPILDRIESLGCGYREKYEWITDRENIKQYAQLYVAMEGWIVDHLTPFDWYKGYVVQGAIENKLGEDYINYLRGITCMQDPDRARREEHFTVLTSLR